MSARRSQQARGMWKNVALALMTTSIVGCDNNPLVDTDGDGDPTNDCLGEDCEPPPPPQPFIFEVDNTTVAHSWFAAGGRARMVITANDPQGTAPVVTRSSNDDSGMSITTWTTATRSTVVEFLGGDPGDLRIEFTNNLAKGWFARQVRDVGEVRLVIPDIYAAEPITRVMGETTLFAALCPEPGCTYGTHGEPRDLGPHLVDTTLAIAAPSAVVQAAWDTFSLPASPGRYPLQLAASSFGTATFEVEVVDRVDDVVFDTVFTSHGGGTLCFAYTRSGDRVASRDWSWSSPTSGVEVHRHLELDNCVRYYNPARTATTLVVSGAGISRTIELAPVP
jgi:hypothetical protein